MGVTRWFESVCERATTPIDPDGRVSMFDEFSPEGDDPSLVRRVANPAARLRFADLDRPLDPMIADTPLAVDRRETFLGGLYTVTIARPSAEEGV